MHRRTNIHQSIKLAKLAAPLKWKYMLVSQEYFDFQLIHPAKYAHSMFELVAVRNICQYFSMWRISNEKFKPGKNNRKYRYIRQTKSQWLVSLTNH